MCTLLSHFASASGGLRPQISYRGFAPGPQWGTSVPGTSWPGPHHVNTLLCKILGTPMGPIESAPFSSIPFPFLSFLCL